MTDLRVRIDTKNKTPGQPVIQVQDTKNEDRCMANQLGVFMSFVGQIREGDVATGKKTLDLPDRSAQECPVVRQIMQRTH